MKETNKNSVYMCMSCGNCLRKNNDNGLFSFSCKHGDFPIDGQFASKIEFIGCRSWLPAGDDYNEPYLIKIDEKHKTVEIGKWGRTFEPLSSDMLYEIYEPYSEEGSEGSGMSEMILKCKEAFGD